MNITIDCSLLNILGTPYTHTQSKLSKWILTCTHCWEWILLSGKGTLAMALFSFVYTLWQSTASESLVYSLSMLLWVCSLSSLFFLSLLFAHVSSTCSCRIDENQASWFSKTFTRTRVALRPFTTKVALLLALSFFLLLSKQTKNLTQH